MFAIQHAYVTWTAASRAPGKILKGLIRTSVSDCGVVHSSGKDYSLCLYNIVAQLECRGFSQALLVSLEIFIVQTQCV